MYILTDKSLINCNNVKVIKIARDGSGYEVLAEPGGIIASFETQQEAIDYIDSIARAIAYNVNVFNAKEK